MDNTLATGDTGLCEDINSFLNVYGHNKDGSLNKLGVIFVTFCCISYAYAIVNYINSRNK